MREQLAAAAETLAIDALTCTVIGALREAGVEPILLKGPSFSSWLYATAPRFYRDTDLLVDPRQETRARQVLRSLGCTPYPSVVGVPEHSTTWWHPGFGLEIDLHTRLPLTTAGSANWRRLCQQTEQMQLGTMSVTTLDEVARVFHVVIHALQNSRQGGVPKEDLKRAMNIVPEQGWRKAAALASTLGASDAFAVGLAVCPAGEELSQRLGLAPTTNTPVHVRLYAMGEDASGAAALHHLSQLSGFPARLAFFIRKGFPAPQIVRYSLSTGGPIESPLPLLYLRYWLRLARKAPHAMRVWKATRGFEDRSRR